MRSHRRGGAGPGAQTFDPDLREHLGPMADRTRRSVRAAGPTMTVHRTAARRAMPSARCSTRSPAASSTITSAHLPPRSTPAATCCTHRLQPRARDALRRGSCPHQRPDQPAQSRRPGGNGGRARRPCGHRPPRSSDRALQERRVRCPPLVLVKLAPDGAGHATRRVTSPVEGGPSVGPAPLARLGGQMKPASSSRKRRNARRRGARARGVRPAWRRSRW